MHHNLGIMIGPEAHLSCVVSHKSQFHLMHLCGTIDRILESELRLKGTILIRRPACHVCSMLQPAYLVTRSLYWLKSISKHRQYFIILSTNISCFFSSYFLKVWRFLEQFCSSRGENILKVQQMILSFPSIHLALIWTTANRGLLFCFYRSPKDLEKHFVV